MNSIDRIKSVIRRKIRKRTLIFLGVFSFVFLSLSGMLGIKCLPVKCLSVGEVAAADIEAPSSVEFIDQEATNKAKMLAANSVKAIYPPDRFVAWRAETSVTKTFEIIRRMHQNSSPQDASKINEIRNSIPISLSSATIRTLLGFDMPTLDALELRAKETLGNVMQKGIRQETLPEAKKRIKTICDGLPLPPQYVPALVEVGQNALEANVKPDWEATVREQQRKIAEVKPVITSIPKGQVVIRKGEIVTPEHLKILEKLGISGPFLNPQSLIGSGLFILVVIGLVLGFLKQQLPRVYNDGKLLFLLSIIVVAVAGTSRLLTPVSGYLAPVATASLTIAILLDSRLALLCTAILSILVSMFTGEIYSGGTCLLTGVAAVLSVNRVSRQSDLITASLIVVGTNIFSSALFGLIRNDDLLAISVNSLFYGGINGLSSCLIAIGAMLFFENLFGITTHLKLLELSNPSEPLLQRLVLEAQGTYHHSIIVGNLAQAAARSIGADELLARVGAYYHDIGKIKRPYLFYENQMGAENPHDKLAPSLSTLIVTSHVKEGLELARQYQIPEPIHQIIGQHHGTSLVAYFYHQARITGGEEVRQENFRYPGPKPGSKEAAIVMIADAVEAAIRSLSKPNSSKIQTLVKQIIKDMLDDGQFDESELSFSNIKNITNSLTQTLNAIYHPRIEYPEKIAQDFSQALKERKVFALPKRSGKTTTELRQASGEKRQKVE